MLFRLPVRRFFQSTDKTETPSNRVGTVQWVLSRALYRFQTFDLTQVPAKNRAQALRLELNQWTPFVNSNYYVGWHGQHAVVWGWDTDKVTPAIVSQGLKVQRVQILPETALQMPFQDGLCLSRCQQGFEGQLWRKAQLERSRWWPQLPAADEWLMFQRDAGIAPTEQQSQTPAPRESALSAHPWVKQASSADDKAARWERMVAVLGAFLLVLPTFWYGFSLYKVQASTTQLREQQAQMQRDVEPITKDRSQALDYLARINALRSLAPYPEQLALLAKIALALPQDRSFIKEWDYKPGQLKVTINASGDISTTGLISLLQQAGPFRDVKALPGRDPKSVTFQMEITGS